MMKIPVLRFLRNTFVTLCALVAGSALQAQSANATGAISIRLEQKLGNLVKVVPQNTVFHNGDILRFRLTSRISGYLYVVDQGTSGSVDTLFPAPEGGNRIEPSQGMLVPASGDGWFQVSGPAGFDVLYFLVSDTPLTLPPAAAPAHSQEQQEEPPPPGMLPRCDDKIFQARGECLDGSAGVAALPPGAPIPRELKPLARSASRDIILTDDGGGTTVQAAPQAKLPLVYTFRLAHRD